MQISRHTHRRRLSLGFSLVELMVTLAIVTLVAGVVATGMPVAADAYTRVVDSANAQAQLTTATAVLRDRLSHARDVEVADDADATGYATVTSFVDGETGYTAYLWMHGEEGILEADVQPSGTAPKKKDVANLREELKTATGAPGTWHRLLEGVGSQRNGWDLVVGYDSTAASNADNAGDLTVANTGRLTYNATERVFCVEGLKVWRSTHGAPASGGLPAGKDNPLIELEGESDLYVRQVLVGTKED